MERIHDIELFRLRGRCAPVGAAAISRRGVERHPGVGGLQALSVDGALPRGFV